jgi:alpha-galactosidase/6-phospho-beta-glucosidase family protein
LILFWSNGRTALAQTPSDYFVGGANLYINGETERAKDYVDSGLLKYPDDKKLQALKKAIEEEEKKKNKDNEKQQDQNKDQQNNKQDQQDQQQQQKDGYISKEDAQRLLDALANDEKNVQEKVKEAKAAKARVRTLVNW